MGKNDLAIFGFGVTVYMFALRVYLKNLITKEHELTRLHIANLYNMQTEWLFNQLYNIAPGKVLKPDEEVTESKPVHVKVIHKSRDPMREFDGGIDDFHDPRVKD